MRRALGLAIVLAGCGAQLSEDVPSDAGPNDGPRFVLDGGADAPPSPIDARPCTGTQDPSTGTCLVFNAGPSTYAQAEAACTAMMAKLVVIKSAGTNATVLSLVGTLDAFVGSDDRTVEMSFRWLGNAADPVITGFTNWRAGEPNNGGTGSTIQEDCMILEGARGGTWDDRPCDASEVPTAGRYAYVCQY